MTNLTPTKKLPRSTDRREQQDLKQQDLHGPAAASAKPSGEVAYRDKFFDDDQIDDGLTLENCEALIVCMDAGSFAIVRPDGKQNLWPTQGGWDCVRQLQPGQTVIYQGKPRLVCAVDVFR
ncbi:hypothetical protein K227x_54020 [Rubripirellula lacrimiformis]|uniref:Uncharacterized protein n=1 Tax=Rubripirellula lacrimiformis TaxID=1930273 RepID=A0A517NIQ6_9BACT|nr:hypothetical protein [Rubripirellula lacrimiformis]QDT06978.1 hypothetical protein K227x_54020 [Rubripirellula lacrimiformis]